MSERVANAIEQLKKECGVTHIYEYKECGAYVQALCYSGSIVVYRVYNDGSIWIKQKNKTPN